MQRTYSKPQHEWGGFRPVVYTLRKAWKLPLTRVSGEGEKKQQTAISVGELILSLKDQQIQRIESGINTEITTPGAVITLCGPSFNREVAEAFLDLQTRGINYFDTQWFWYDKDHVTDDLMASYKFFVVHNDSIVREEVSFCDYSDSGFDPTVFEPEEDSQPIWSNHPDWDEAWVRYWYRTFYTDSKTGQLMVLRPDQPELYYYPEGRWTPQGGAVGLGELLTRIQSLLWIMIALLGLIALVLILRR